MTARVIGNDKGSALLIALALMTMLTVVVIVALDRTTTDIDLSYNRLHGEQAFYIAEAGAKRACAELGCDPLWRNGFNDVAFNAGEYTVTVIDSSIQEGLDDTVIVTSTSNRDQAAAAIEVFLIPVTFHPFQFALFGDSSVDMRNSALTDSYRSDSGSYASTRIFDKGDVGSNGEIVVHNSADIGGDVATSEEGALSLNFAATIAGDTTSKAPRREILPVPDEEFDLAEAVNDNATGISGTYSYNPATDAFVSTGTVTFQTGTYFFSSLILKNSASLEIAAGAEVVIYVTGDIELKNSSEVNDGGSPMDLQFYSQGDIVLKNSGDIYATFYSPEGFGDLRNSGDFYGSIVTRDVLVHNSAGFHYDRRLGDVEWPDISGMMVVAWREL